MSEAALLRSTLHALRLTGYVVLRLNAGLTVLGRGAARRVIRGVEAGTPDLCVLRPGGRVVWIEAKSKIGRLSPSQLKWHARARALGHAVYVVRSVKDALEAVR